MERAESGQQAAPMIVRALVAAVSEAEVVSLSSREAGAEVEPVTRSSVASLNKTS